MAHTRCTTIGPDGSAASRTSMVRVVGGPTCPVASIASAVSVRVPPPMARPKPTRTSKRGSVGASVAGTPAPTIQ